MNGKQIELENAKVNCITENVDVDYYHTHCAIAEIHHKSYELEVSVGNITKKRFIKLLMAKGIQRNGAVEFAKYIHRKYGCYNPMYLMLFQKVKNFLKI